MTPQDLDGDDDLVREHPIEVSVQQKRPEDIGKPALIEGVLFYLLYSTGQVAGLHNLQVSSRMPGMR